MPPFLPGTYRLGAGIISVQEAYRATRRGLSTPLAITNERGLTCFYYLSIIWCQGELLGYQLIKDLPEGTIYTLDKEVTSCNCKDSQIRNRPEGCKHRRVIRSLKNRRMIP